ncbi:MAG TPA: type II secretion system F family protein, partial [Desulfobacterales bacterium]|nr:type II secretion system F family protein [Desulfobacterales bacterium]
MPVFEYTALDARGRSTSGIIDADGLQAARQKLRASGKFPVAIREAREAGVSQDSKRGRARRLGDWFSRVKPGDVAMTTRQMATLIGAGFPLVSALDALLPQTHSRGLQRTLARVKDLVVEGN